MLSRGTAFQNFSFSGRQINLPNKVFREEAHKTLETGEKNILSLQSKMPTMKGNPAMDRITGFPGYSEKIPH
jgi:hypothetical protein